jgi:hypothetical protein
MKQLTTSLLAVILLLSLNSCGVSNAFVFNTNQNSTQVSLSQANYKVIGKATGSSDVSYVFIFGGARKKQLFGNAYARMVENANLSSGSKALINIVTEEHVGGVPPFYYTRTVTVSANVIEFTN